MKRDHLEDIYNLSPVQEGMLFHGLETEGWGAFLQQFVYEVEGELDAAALAHAFQETVDRHPTLRTAFIWERKGRPLQVVVRQAKLPVILERWSPVEPAEERCALTTLLAQDQKRGLDVGAPPLLRLTLVQVGGGLRYLLWTYHHAILDGWSMALVLREVLSRYQAHHGGLPFERRPPRPFRDYIAWLARQDLAAAETYWRRTLADLQSAPPLPLGNGGDDGRRTLVLPAAVHASLEARAHRSGLTLNTLVQGAWALLLSRTGGLNDVVFGTVVSGRPAEIAGIEEMVGLFINTLPTRVRISPGRRLGEWLRQLQMAQLEMRRYEYSPLSQVHAWSGAPAGQLLFETVLVFENRALFAVGAGEQPTGAPRLRPVDYRGEAGYPLIATVEPGEGLALTLTYDRSRLDRIMIERWLEQFAVLVEDLGGDLDRVIESLCSIRPAERRQLVSGGQSEKKPGEAKADGAVLPPPGSAEPDPAHTSVAPRTAHEQRLAEIWSEVLGVARIGVHDNFFELGGDSILILKVVARARKAGLKLTSRQFFAHQRLAELAAVATSAVRVSSGSRPITGEVPLTPIQRWFFESVQTDLHHWNQAVLMATRRQLIPAHLERAVGELLAHHDAFLLRFVPTTEGWHQRHSGTPTQASFLHLDLAGLPEERRIAGLEAAAAELQGTLHIEHGPLLRVALFNLGGAEPARLLLLAHHLVIDSVSWGVLFEDLTTALDQIARGEVLRLPPKTTSFQHWAELLAAHAQTPAVAAELDFWLRETAALIPLPRDHRAGRNTEATRRTVIVSLTPGETHTLLRELPRVYGTRIDDVLLTAVALAFRAWTGHPRLLLDLEGHGREELFEDIDVSRTIGWFTILYPMLIDLEEPAGAVAALRAVKEQLRRIPGRGIGYGLLRYLHADLSVRERLGSLPRAEVVVNYLGQFDGNRDENARWETAHESGGPQRGLCGERIHLFDLSGYVEAGRFFCEWSYSVELHDRAPVERLAGGFLIFLRQLIEHCAAPRSGGVVPDDFPLARIDPLTLDRLAASGPRFEDLYPLSPMQQGMLFDSLHDERGTYVTQLSWEVHGDLDTAVFAAAWKKVLDRHPPLRTVFVWEGCNQPLQVVLCDPPLPFAEEDWQGLDKAERQRRMEQLAARHLRLDLKRGPLLRLELLRFADRAWRFVWTFHHLVLDGWSMPMVLMEFLAIYRAQRRGAEAQLPTRRPFRDFIAWLAQRDLAAAERYFRRSLAGYAGASPLRPLLQSPEYLRQRGREGDVVRRLSAERTTELQAFARRYHLTLNILIQGAWALLLSRLGDSYDVVFGVTVAGRPAALAGVEEMIGMFINTLPVRLRTAADVSLVTWLREHQESHAELGEYEHTPLAKIQQWCLMPPGAALFESIVVVENYPTPAGRAEDESDALDFIGFRFRMRESFPLVLVVGPAAELSLQLKYDEDRYRRSALADLLADLEALLLQFPAAPEAPLERFTTWLDSRTVERRETLKQEIREMRHERLIKATRRRVETA